MVLVVHDRSTNTLTRIARAGLWRWKADPLLHVTEFLDHAVDFARPNPTSPTRVGCFSLNASGSRIGVAQRVHQIQYRHRVAEVFPLDCPIRMGAVGINWMRQTRTAVVVSEEQGEVEKFRKWDLDITPHRRLIKEGMDLPESMRNKPQFRNMQRMELDDAFKEEEHPFRIALVCAMWLWKFDQELNDEERRAVREGLDEESLALFDLLRKPDLNAKDVKRVKEVAVELLAKLKAEKLRVDHWKDKEATRDAVSLAIRDHLWDDVTGLPVDAYTEDDVNVKAEAVYQHVYRAYPTVPSPFYHEVA